MRSLPLVFVLCCASPAAAELLFYEGFTPRNPDDCPLEICLGRNYADGERLVYHPDPDAEGNPNGQYNEEYGRHWRRTQGASNSTAHGPVIITGSLSYPGLPAPAAGSNHVVLSLGQNNPIARIAVKLDENGDAVSLNTVGDTWYWSGILQISGISRLNHNNINPGGGIVLAGYTTDAGPAPGPTATTTVFSAHLAVSKNPDDEDQYYIASGINNANKAFAFSSPINDGDTVFVVASHTRGATMGEDVVKLWVNPDESTFGAATEPTPSASITNITSGNRVTPTGFTLRDSNPANTGGPPLVQFDELRLATTWAEVTGAIIVPPDLPGDYNGDGLVDAADFVLWQKTPGEFGGDPGGYETWRASFGRSSGDGGSALAAVPEPSSLAPALAALLLAAAGRRKSLRNPK